KAEDIVSPDHAVHELIDITLHALEYLAVGTLYLLRRDLNIAVELLRTGGTGGQYNQYCRHEESDSGQFFHRRSACQYDDFLQNIRSNLVLGFQLKFINIIVTVNDGDPVGLMAETGT